jgi:hypothetical protein
MKVTFVYDGEGKSDPLRSKEDRVPLEKRGTKRFPLPLIPAIIG